MIIFLKFNYELLITGVELLNDLSFSKLDFTEIYKSYSTTISSICILAA